MIPILRKCRYLPKVQVLHHSAVIQSERSFDHVHYALFVDEKPVPFTSKPFYPSPVVLVKVSMYDIAVSGP